MVARQRTSGLLACGDLGHVDDGRNTRGPRRDGHIRGSFEEPVSVRRVAEVHPLDVTHREANRRKIKEVADNHVSTKYPQSLRSVINCVYEGTDWEPALDEPLGDRRPCLSSGSCYENQWLRHDRSCVSNRSRVCQLHRDRATPMPTVKHTGEVVRSTGNSGDNGRWRYWSRMARTDRVPTWVGMVPKIMGT